MTSCSSGQPQGGFAASRPPFSANIRPLQLTLVVCQICFQSKRKTRFASSRLNICQWCITELCTTELSPGQIITIRQLEYQQKRREAIERQVALLECSLSSTPELDPMQLVRAESRALHDVKKSEGLLIAIYRSIFDDNARQAEATRMATARKREIITAHGQVVADHATEQVRIKNQISALLVEIDQIPMKCEMYIETLLENVLTGNPTKSKQERILRAYQTRVINFEREKLERPDEQSYDGIKKEIRQQDQYRCVCFGRGPDRGELHVHHIVPLYQFDTNDYKNLVTLCHPCHNK